MEININRTLPAKLLSIFDVFLELVKTLSEYVTIVTLRPFSVKILFNYHSKNAFKERIPSCTSNSSQLTV